MDIQLESRKSLENWGKWIRSQPDPFKHLNYGVLSMFKEWKPPWRESEIDSDYLAWRNEDRNHDPDSAAEADKTVRMLTREDQQVYLYAYFCQWGSKRKIAEKFGESRRNVDLRLANALGAYEVLFEIREILKKAG